MTYRFKHNGCDFEIIAKESRGLAKEREEFWYTITVETHSELGLVTGSIMVQKMIAPGAKELDQWVAIHNYDSMGIPYISMHPTVEDWGVIPRKHFKATEIAEMSCRTIWCGER